ncbi:hypothetical protein DIZ27_39495 [Streptomyces sp. NWU339]|uniref:hypothetical protein n=1 Tax=Streptomyces sp. NWU339 TaxID=2185284 RepID=UPI000D6781C6|nr:hypothetical protein [Streptomyces sp. NWU339]PWI05426.1 hypothetical protein DIZ27_39495 [Streptomyces sp. NWU339]
MTWQTDEFRTSHEGFVGAVLADGSEPKPVVLDVGSGTNGYQTREWWAYTGQWGRPKAAGYRAACACGWRGQSHPVDWEQVDDGRLDEVDVSAARDDWVGHIGTVDRQAVPLPDELTDALGRLEEQLGRLADQAPVAALRAVGELERLTRSVGHRAACAAEDDGLAPETIGRALGISAEAARSRLAGYRLRD